MVIKAGSVHEDIRYKISACSEQENLALKWGKLFLILFKIKQTEDAFRIKRIN
jgi:hypothetical protein